MNITSILITIVGIIVIIALYLISRLSISKLPKQQATSLPDLKDEEGNQFTSVLDDIAATDGVKPNSKTSFKHKNAPEKQSSKEIKTNDNQLILFISPKSEKGLEGNKIKQSLQDNGLVLGDKNIYHYFQSQQDKTSLFRVANGVEPWTLTDDDLNKKHLKGLSLVLQIPKDMNESSAKQTFYSLSYKISQALNGILKDENQEILSQGKINTYISK